MRRHFCAAAVVLLAATLPAAAQTTLPLVGAVISGDPQSASHLAQRDAFLRGMADLGYVEGRNISYDIRFWGWDTDRIPEIMAEFARKPVDIILTQATVGALAARAHAPAIPTVFASAADPVGRIADSLGRPGGKMTGLALLSPELAVKRLELLKELLPKVRSVAVLRRRGEEHSARSYLRVEMAAPSLGLKPRPFDAAGVGDVEDVVHAITGWPAEAVLILEDPNILAFFPFPSSQQPAARALRGTVPTVCPFRNYVERGCLMSYGPSLPDMFYRAASYVDKILKGAEPGELPVQQPIKFELVVNMKTARTLGLTIPREFLYRVTEVIE